MGRLDSEPGAPNSAVRLRHQSTTLTEDWNQEGGVMLEHAVPRTASVAWRAMTVAPTRPRRWRRFTHRHRVGIAAAAFLTEFVVAVGLVGELVR